MGDGSVSYKTPACCSCFWCCYNGAVPGGPPASLALADTPSKDASPAKTGPRQTALRQSAIPAAGAAGVGAADSGSAPATANSGTVGYGSTSKRAGGYS